MARAETSARVKVKSEQVAEMDGGWAKHMSDAEIRILGELNEDW